MKAVRGLSPLPWGARVYRSLLVFYPRQFRQEYGDDLVLLLIDQLGDERAGRAYSRAGFDLLLTVPARHLEARMKRPPSALVPLIFAAASLMMFLMGGVGGSSPFGGLLLLAPALGFGALGFSAWRRSRPFDDNPMSTGWWRYLAAGAGLLAFIAVSTTITGELPEGMWFVAMAGLLTSFGLMITGAVLGLSRLTGRGRGGVAA